MVMDCVSTEASHLSLGYPMITYVSFFPSLYTYLFDFININNSFQTFTLLVLQFLLQKHIQKLTIHFSQQLSNNKFYVHI